MNKNYQLIVLFVLFIVFFEFLKLPYNSYILLKRSYVERMISNYGYCEKEGYGFVNKNINNKIIRSNFYIENKGDFPSIKGFFYNFNYKTNNETYVFLINQKKEKFDEKYSKSYKILKQEGKCFLLKKND